MKMKEGLAILPKLNEGASILLPCMCTVRETYTGFIAPTEAHGLSLNALPSVIGVGPNKCKCKVPEEAGFLRSSFLSSRVLNPDQFLVSPRIMRNIMEEL